MPDKPPTIQPIMMRKSVFYVTKNFSNNAKHMLRLQPLYFITLTSSSEDQSQEGIEEKLCEMILKSSLVNQAFLTAHLFLSNWTFSGISFLGNRETKIKAGAEL